MLYVRGESVQGHYNFNEYPIRGFCVVFPRNGIFILHLCAELLLDFIIKTNNDNNMLKWKPCCKWWDPKILHINIEFTLSFFSLRISYLRPTCKAEVK